MVGERGKADRNGSKEEISFQNVYSSTENTGVKNAQNKDEYQVKNALNRLVTSLGV